MQFPKYKCHKEVSAVKIMRVEDLGAAAILFLENIPDGYGVLSAWRTKHNPLPGGYLVRYEDGYESFSPCDAFESGYTLMEENN